MATALESSTDGADHLHGLSPGGLIAASERRSGAEQAPAADRAFLGALYLLISRDDVDLFQLIHAFGAAIDARQLTLYVLAGNGGGEGASPLPGEGKGLHEDRARADEGPNEASQRMSALGWTAAPSSKRRAAGAQNQRAEVKVKPASARDRLLGQILEDQASGWVLPIISPTQGLHGYLDALPFSRQEGFGRQESRSLHYLSILLAGYFDRRGGARPNSQESGDGSTPQRVVKALEKQQSAIGRELHDNIGQLLTSIRMLAENQATKRAEENGAARAQRIAGLAGKAVVEVGKIHQQLSAPDLFDITFETALEGLAVRMDELSDARCSFICEVADPEDLVGPEGKLQLYRIAQEATNNAVKYAQAQHIRVTLAVRAQAPPEQAPPEQALVLHIRDDGQGFEPDAPARESSSGLSNMSYRAGAVGGTLHIDTAPGAGTTVTCTLPMDA